MVGPIINNDDECGLFIPLRRQKSDNTTIPLPPYINEFLSALKDEKIKATHLMIINICSNIRNEENEKTIIASAIDCISSRFDAGEEIVWKCRSLQTSILFYTETQIDRQTLVDSTSIRLQSVCRYLNKQWNDLRPSGEFGTKIYFEFTIVENEDFAIKEIKKMIPIGRPMVVSSDFYSLNMDCLERLLSVNNRRDDQIKKIFDDYYRRREEFLLKGPIVTN